MRTQYISFIVGLGLIVGLSGCGSKLSSLDQERFQEYKNRGIYVEKKSTGTATALGLLPGGGSYYTEEYGVGTVNLLLWPISILWDPVSGYNGAEAANYHATKRYARKLMKKEIRTLEDNLEDDIISQRKYNRERRKIEDKYDVM